jgi:hypothetical protein
MFRIYLDTSVISALFDDKNPEYMPNLEIQGYFESGFCVKT